MMWWTLRRMRIVRHATEKARTEAILARERAEAADSAKSAFLATVSHEIRTPMNGVIGVLDILHDTPLSTEQKHYLDTAMQSARLLLRVINDILDYAKIESGALPLWNAPYDLYLAMENMAELYLPLARRKGLKLTVAIMPHFDKQLLGDEIRVSQVVANLLSNAIAFTERGEIILAAHRHVSNEQDHIEISIHDTGAGMSEEYQQRLFSPFQQEDTSTTRRHGGTGLGLSIVKHLVERMGGNISINSQRGHGTRVLVRLPARWTNNHTLTWPRYTGRTAALNLDCPVTTPMLQAWCHKAGIATVSKDIPADIRILVDSDAGFWVVTEATRHGPFYSLYPFLHTLHTLWTAPKSPPALTTAHTDPHASNTPETRYFSSCHEPQKRAGVAAHKKPPLSSNVALTLPNSESQILLVEDNEINRDITLRQLSLLGISAYAMENGETGYEAWLQHRPRVMFVDCHMPKLDGYGLARRIRTQEMINGWPRTILIGFSANATQSDARACRAAGMDDYVPKPTTREKLSEALQRAGFLAAVNEPESIHPVS
jgi:CheY-like chemotaxis protein/nitrogen-specific signal transduction histidine kinase